MGALDPTGLVARLIEEPLAAGLILALLLALAIGIALRRRARRKRRRMYADYFRSH